MSADMRIEKTDNKTGISGREENAVAEAYEIPLKEYVSPPSLGGLARTVGLDRTRLTECFKEMFGVTTREFCLEIKMNQAWHRIARTDEPITNIALSLGYEHNANFSTAIKRWFGKTPRGIRQPN